LCVLGANVSGFWFQSFHNILATGLHWKYLPDGIIPQGHQFFLSQQDCPRHHGCVWFIQRRSEENIFPWRLYLKLLHNVFLLQLYLMFSHTCLGQIEFPLSTTSTEKSQKTWVSFLSLLWQSTMLSLDKLHYPAHCINWEITAGAILDAELSISFSPQGRRWKIYSVTVSSE
jgi:hypothetical protein